MTKPILRRETLHYTHKTRISLDASSFDEICTLCGRTDIAGGGWGLLAEPCPEVRMAPHMYNWFDISLMTVPKAGIGECIVDAWWIVKADKIAFWRDADHPQCNQDRRVAETVRDKLHPGAEVRQLHMVFTGNTAYTNI